MQIGISPPLTNEISNNEISSFLASHIISALNTHTLNHMQLLTFGVDTAIKEIFLDVVQLTVLKMQLLHFPDVSSGTISLGGR